MMDDLRDWHAVQMGSEGWAVFGPLRDLPYGHMLASNLTEEDARLIASAPGLQQRVEALIVFRNEVAQIADDGLDGEWWKEGIQTCLSALAVRLIEGKPEAHILEQRLSDLLEACQYMRDVLNSRKIPLPSIANIALAAAQDKAGEQGEG